MNRIENLLRKEIGLDAASVGSSLIERTIRLRMKSLGVAKLDDYRDLLDSSRAELNELIESVVVTETWFFRDREPFSAFSQLVQQHFQANGRSTTPVRILSAPCSTGEEPYSLAMALIDAAVPRAQFVIDAVDLSVRALERAKQAVYGKNSFRGKALDFRNRHFSQTAETFKLHDAVRDCVKFHQGNLLEDKLLTSHDSYDFIFCRNLLIYFDRATQKVALRKLHQLLSGSGVLFVGPAEMPLVSDHGFAPIGLPMSFACRKADATNSINGNRRETPRRPVKAAPRPPPPVAVAIALPAPETKRPASRRAAEVPIDLNAARALADSGNLIEAATMCEAYLKANGPSAQAYYLLGLVRDAGGDATAVEFYRKALYLEPNHYESLLQMSLLSEKNGDPVAARTFKRRAERSQQSPMHSNGHSTES